MIKYFELTVYRPVEQVLYDRLNSNPPVDHTDIPTIAETLELRRSIYVLADLNENLALVTFARLMNPDASADHVGLGLILLAERDAPHGVKNLDDRAIDVRELPADSLLDELRISLVLGYQRRNETGLYEPR